MTINAHPELPKFDYIRPGSVGDASQFLIENAGTARIILGGTDVFVRLRDGVWRNNYLVDVKNLEGMKDINYNPISGIRIASAVNMNEVITSKLVQTHYPLLAAACRSVASYQLRSRATVVGNICNASPAGDTIGACMVLEARLEIFNTHHQSLGARDSNNGRSGYRLESLPEFFTGPGKTILQPGDIVTAVLLPSPRPDAVGTYIKLGRNNWSDLSIVGVTVYAHPDAGLKSGYRFHIALASVAPVPLVVTSAEEFLAQNHPGEKAFRQAAELAQEACNPIDDIRSSARYRKEMVTRLVEKGLSDLWSGLAK